MGELMASFKNSHVDGQTPLDDVSGLIARGAKTRAALNALEADNIRKAVVLYLAARPSKRQAPFTLKWLYRLHRQMFGQVWQWAGVRRQTELNIGVPAHQVDIELQKMLDNLAYWTEHTEMDLIEQSARLHHRAVSIHPFLNGNGRWARLLSNIWLRRSGPEITIWPEERIGAASIIRNEYLDAVRAADSGDLAPLLGLHRRYTMSAT